MVIERHVELKAIRTNRGWTQSQMAYHVNLSTDYYALLERGGKRINDRIMADARAETD